MCCATWEILMPSTSLDRTHGCHKYPTKPRGIVYWLVFKRPPVQTTYLILQAFLNYFYSQEMLTTSEIRFTWYLTFTLSVGLQTIRPMTSYVENCGQKGLDLYTCVFINMMKMITWRKSLAWYCSTAGIFRNFFLIFIFCSPINYIFLHLSRPI